MVPERLAPYKIPQYIEFRDMLPKSKVGKLLRREVREEEQENIQRKKTRIEVDIQFWFEAPLTPSLSHETVSEGGERTERQLGSFRIAIILRLWPTVLTVENSVCMVSNPMILFAKRFRSKAPSATSLSSGQFVGSPGTGCDFLPAPYCDTVSPGRGEG